MSVRDEFSVHLGTCGALPSTRTSERRFPDRFSRVRVGDGIRVKVSVRRSTRKKCKIRQRSERFFFSYQSTMPLSAGVARPNRRRGSVVHYSPTFGNSRNYVLSPSCYRLYDRRRTTKNEKIPRDIAVCFFSGRIAPERRFSLRRKIVLERPPDITITTTATTTTTSTTTRVRWLLRYDCSRLGKRRFTWPAVFTQRKDVTSPVRIRNTVDPKRI